jgi:rubrerythrin
MHGEILAAQSSAMSGYQREAALLEEISDLKKRVADFETWDTEKERYELKDLGYGAVAYMLKPNARGTEPPHWVCAHCYQNGKVFFLQLTFDGNTRQNARRGWFCPSCHNETKPANSKVVWLD